MKRFNFNLEKVLQLRKYRERETEIELGRAMGVLLGIERRIEEVRAQLTRAGAEQFSPEHSMETIQDYHRFILRLEVSRDKLLEEAVQAEAAVEEARKIYLEASRDRKVLDKVKELRQKEYRREMFAAETMSLDDISGGRGAREAVIGI